MGVQTQVHGEVGLVGSGKRAQSAAKRLLAPVIHLMHPQRACMQSGERAQAASKTLFLHGKKTKTNVKKNCVIITS
jgi:hypothetical protein